MLFCQGSACQIFKSLLPGTIVTVTADSGNIIGPAVFTKFDPITGTVTLIETTGVTPSTTSITKIGCAKIESITFTV
ncbi:CGEA protein [Terrilactibacillus sp. S3-3]|nr:CGEA protein [Terrilactibacillus sp. S3-3]